MHLNRSAITIVTTALLAAGFAANLFLPCGSNLVAFAAVAALTLGFRRGSLLALGIWLESQVLGFAVFGYPHTPMTVAWGIALAGGTVLAAAIATACANRGSIAAFAGAFAAYELALATFALASGSGLSAFSPGIVGQLFISNSAVALAGLAFVQLLAAARAGVGEALARKGER